MCFFFFKQKTAYEMRISDWSSDVCSSDLARSRRLEAIVVERRNAAARNDSASQQIAQLAARRGEAETELAKFEQIPLEIEGRRGGLLDELAKAEAERQLAADQLANAEAAQQLAARTAREIEQKIGRAHV